MSLIIKQFQLGQLQANCYLVYEKQSKNAVIIDPGGEGDEVSDYVMREDLNVNTILITPTLTTTSAAASSSRSTRTRRLTSSTQFDSIFVLHV